MHEPLEIEIGDFTFHVVVTGWPSRGGATSPPYGAEWHLEGVSYGGGDVEPWTDAECPQWRLNQINDRVQEAVADWTDAEDQRR